MNDFSDGERAVLYRAIQSDPVADDVLMRILAAAHMAPSVGLSQPWRFIIVRDPAFAPLADLERDGWEARAALDDVVDYERYGGP